MVQETRKIAEHIEMEREKLGENLEEFESRIKGATNPKNWFDSNPALFLGAAAAGGVLLGILVTPSKHKEWETGWEDTEPLSAPTVKQKTPSPHVSAVREVVDLTLGALIGLGTRKFQDLVSQTLPGFREEFDETRRRQAAWNSDEVNSQRPH
jgi:hypothetical protein